MKLIDKDALVAEITKRAKEGEIVGRDIPSSAIFGLTQAYKNVLSFIDTLEVKEVDLEKEIKRFTMSKELYEADSVIKAVAEHFFELGLKARKGDKVEPKFKIGDWVVRKDGKNFHDGKTVQFTKTDEIACQSVSGRRLYEDKIRLWTINDAKDGEALCYKDEISLYKHDIKNCTKEETTFGGFVYHCCYDGKRFIMDSLYSLTEQDKMDIHPATKEQRDLLFQKMKESGYTWDSKKKEPIRI